MNALLIELRMRWLKARYEAQTSPVAARYADRLVAMIEQAKRIDQKETNR